MVGIGYGEGAQIGPHIQHSNLEAYSGGLALIALSWQVASLC